MNEPYRILVVEDDADEAASIAIFLRGRLPAEVEIARDCAGARKAMSGADFDVVTVDYRLPDGDGIALVNEFVSAGEHPPFVMVTGYGDEETASRCYKAGASGYVIKDTMFQSTLLSTVEKALEQWSLEQALQAGGDRFKQMFDNMSSCVAVYKAQNDGHDFLFVDFNRAAEKVEQVKKEDVLGRSIVEVFPGVVKFGLLEVLRRVWRTGQAEQFPVSWYQDGRVSGWKENYVYKLSTGELVAVYDDMTQQVQAEESLRRNEAKYRFLADNMNDVVWTSDLGLNTDYISPSSTKLLGFTVEEYLKRGAGELLTPESLKVAIDILTDELAHDSERDPERTGIVELYYYHADGSTRCLETSISFIRDSTGVPTGFYGLSRDVTERKLIEKALEQSEELFREMAEVANDALVVMDSAGRVTYWNPAAEKIFGYASDEILGQELVPLLSHPRDLDENQRKIREFAATGKGAMLGHPVEFMSLSKEGKVIPVEVSSSAFRSGDEWRAVLNARDITERIRAKEAALRRTRELQDLIDVAAHELRHPATVLKGYAAILVQHRGRLDDDTAMDAITSIERAADRLSVLIGQLLDTSRIEHRSIQLDIRKVDPWIVMSRAVEESRNAGSDNVFNLRPCAEKWTVSLDEERINDVLVILLDNAMKYSPPGSEIEIQCEAHADATVFSVSDRGPGVPEEYARTVFERFFQVVDAEHHSVPGIGLGLYIAKAYVEAHGGWIKVEPRPGGGSVFSFTIPRVSKASSTGHGAATDWVSGD
jgi:PAS domain S-box-containing protein